MLAKSFAIDQVDDDGRNTVSALGDSNDLLDRGSLEDEDELPRELSGSKLLSSLSIAASGSLLDDPVRPAALSVFALTGF